MSEIGDEMLTMPEPKLLATEYFDNGSCFGAMFESAKGWNGKHAVSVRVNGRSINELLREAEQLFREWEAAA